MDTVIKSMKENWKFHLGECEAAWYKGYADSHWRSVILPHDWSVEQPFSEEYSSGTGYLAGGIGWYRLHFTLPEEYRGKCIRVIFDGVYKNSQVWCNSYHLGKRPSGYTTFSYDLTPFLCYGEMEGMENEISVKVTHTDLADSRWFTGSGITRKVTLVVEEMVHPAEYGIFFQTRRWKEGVAEIEVDQEIVNASNQKTSVAIETILTDEEEKVCLHLKENIEVNGKSTRKIIMSGTIPNPDVWSPEKPYLYCMKTFYTVNEGERYLVQKEKVGIRSIQFHPENGFFLNSMETKIKGVCVHHDGGCLGAAMTSEVWERRLEALKECGCNAIRCSHNPHMPELYDLCDRMGFLMIDEAFDEWENGKNKWSKGHNVYPPRHQGYFEDFPQWHERDLVDMIRRDRNHPSVILWSIGNEIDYPNDPYCHPMFDTMTGNNDAQKPAAERIYDPRKPDAQRMITLAANLAEIVRREDDSRPVTLAAAFPELSSRLGLFDVLDVTGYNYKEHLYEEDHERFPDMSFLGSENSHSYEAWLAVAEHSYISGQFLWTGIDFLGEAKGWPVHGSPAGLLTCAGYKKPEYYRRKSFWCDDPVLHIATRRDDGRTEDWIPVSDSWNYKVGEPVIVKCFSNLPEVALCLNGKEVGRQKEYQADGAYCFRMSYVPGVLKAQGYDRDGKVQITRELTTAEAAEKVVCELWTAADDKLTAEIGYLYQIEVCLADKDGRIPVWNDCIVRINVCGDGELAGMENGNLADVTPYSSERRSTYSGRLLGYIRRTGKGRIHVAVDAEIPGSSAFKMEID